MQQTNSNGTANGNGAGADYQQQQWLAMQQYPNSMAMHHPAMMYQQPPPQYMPYHYHQQQLYQQYQTSNQIQSSSGDNKTIWIGDLQHWMDETYLRSCFSQIGEVSYVSQIYGLVSLRVRAGMGLRSRDGNDETTNFADDVLRVKY